MSVSRSSYRRSTSRTWQPYSSGDQASGRGRSSGVRPREDLVPVGGVRAHLGRHVGHRPTCRSRTPDRAGRAPRSSPWCPGIRGHCDGERQQLRAGRADLDLGAHLRADAAVEARDPAAVVEVLLGERVLPVRPEPLLVQPAVEVVPGQDLVLLALARRVPVDVDADGLRAGHPAVVGEVLAPAVEPAAVAPDRLDHLTDPAVPAAQQSFDDAGLAVVVPVADRLGGALVRADRVAQQLQPAVGRLRVELARPLEGRVRLGHEAADADGAASRRASRSPRGRRG